MPDATRERYRVDPDNARWRIVDGEAVVINLTSTHYYSLNKTGTFIWNLLVDGDHGLDDLARAVAAQYGRSTEAVVPDVRAVLDDLTRENLVVRR
jgi:hypothetical protein